MSKILVVNFLFIVSCINTVFSQVDFTRDTLHFNGGQKVYNIDFFGLERFMNWDTISEVSGINDVQFRINNHTNLPIEIKKFSGDNNVISWRNSEGITTIQPNGSYLIQCVFSNDLGYFQSNFKLKFKHDGKKHNIAFETFGFVENVNAYNSNGNKDGKWMSLYDDGKLKSLQYYKDGMLKVDQYYYYYPEGNLRLLMDEFNHLHSYYYETGGIQYEMRPDSRTDYSTSGIVYKVERANEISYYDATGEFVRKSSQLKSEVLNAYEMLIEEEYYSNGNLKRRLYANGKEFTYEENINGCPVKQIDGNTQGIEQIYTYENCEIVARKSTKLELADGTGRHAFAISKGIFKGNQFMTGIIEYYDEESGLLSHVREMKNEQYTDVIWIDSIKFNDKKDGKKHGMWISNNDTWRWKLGTDQIIMKGFFVNGEPRDTIFHFSADGTLKNITLNSLDKSSPSSIQYYPSGNVAEKTFSYVTSKLKSPYKTVIFEDAKNGDIRSMVKNEYTFHFVNERIVERKSPTFSVDFAHSFSHINRKQYTVAKGEFRDEYLYNGNIYYYNSSNELLKTVPVSAGKIDGDRILVFKDPGLEKELLNHKAIDLDRNGYLTQSEINTIQTLNIRGYWIETAVDFFIFPRLKTLKVGGHIVDPVFMKSEQELFKQIKLLANKSPIGDDDRRYNGGRSRRARGGYHGGGGVPIEPGIFIHEIEDPPGPPMPDLIYDFVDVEPHFPGGPEAMMNFFTENIVYPKDASDMAIYGTVYVGFVVNKDGSIEQVAIKKGLTAQVDQEVIRLVRSMPNWVPGQSRGENVRTRFTIPVKFR